LRPYKAAEFFVEPFDERWWFAASSTAPSGRVGSACSASLRSCALSSRGAR